MEHKMDTYTRKNVILYAKRLGSAKKRVYRALIEKPCNHSIYKWNLGGTKWILTLTKKCLVAQFKKKIKK